ncbi:unnamed protein product [Macrosiphum euphorbiae]|uniref:Uncharacterized protein n=1 Tax=Macrosiphum euphorbiae TaxID=13131 RepID=A0AAV0YB97_9HEMI|nr:unnamed protein product [Macrosiphum euphorbiae]
MVLGMGQDSLTNNTSVQRGINHQRVASTKHSITHFGDLGKPQNHVRNDTGRNPWAVWKTRRALSVNAGNTRIVNRDKQVSHRRGRGSRRPNRTPG